MARKIGQMLVVWGDLNEEQLWQVLEAQKQQPGEVLGRVAIDKGLVNEAQVSQAIAEQLGMPVVNLSEMTIPSSVVEQVPETMANVYKVMPISFRDDVLTVAMAYPQNQLALDDLRNLLGFEVRGAVSNEREVMAAIERHYATKQESVEDGAGGSEGARGRGGARAA